MDLAVTDEMSVSVCGHGILADLGCGSTVKCELALSKLNCVVRFVE